MKKGVKKQMAAVALSLLTVSGIGLSGANVVKAASPLKNKATINITAKKVRKPVTKKSSCSVKKEKVFGLVQVMEVFIHQQQIGKVVIQALPL